MQQGRCTEPARENETMIHFVWRMLWLPAFVAIVMVSQPTLAE
jgi:hypothetical protein